MSQPVENLQQLITSHNFSGVIRIVVDGKTRLEHSRGTTRWNGDTPITTNTRFGVASITKMFTTSCIVSLIKDGLLDWDDSLTAHLSEFENEFDREITIDDLLTHRSGLGDYIDDDATLPFAGFPIDDLTTVEAFLPYVRSVRRLPKGEFFYSSAGFILLGLVIERLADCSYVEAVTDRVIKPASLASTDFCRVDAPQPEFAWGILDDGQPNHRHIPPVGGPDGGIVTNVPDIEQFFAWLKSDALTRREIRERLWQPASTLEPNEHYGRGFDVMQFAQRTWVGHTGGDPGVSARAVVDIDSESSIVVLANRGSIAFRVFRAAMKFLESTS